MRRSRWQRGASMVEFAIVAGLFFTLVMMLLDVGKAIYVKNTIDAAARDGARVAVVLNSPDLSQVEAAIKKHSQDVAFAQPCPITSTPSGSGLADNSGAIFMNKMPEGGPGSVVLPGGCVYTTAGGHVTITVTIIYKYKPITPFVAQFLGGGITFTSSSTMTTEY